MVVTQVVLAAMPVVGMMAVPAAQKMARTVQAVLAAVDSGIIEDGDGGESGRDGEAVGDAESS
jgi:hypothetical protein